MHLAMILTFYLIGKDIISIRCTYHHHDFIPHQTKYDRTICLLLKAILHPKAIYS